MHLFINDVSHPRDEKMRKGARKTARERKLLLFCNTKSFMWERGGEFFRGLGKKELSSGQN